MLIDNLSSSSKLQLEESKVSSSESGSMVESFASISVDTEPRLATSLGTSPQAIPGIAHYDSPHSSPITIPTLHNIEIKPNLSSEVPVTHTAPNDPTIPATPQEHCSPQDIPLTSTPVEEPIKKSVNEFGRTLAQAVIPGSTMPYSTEMSFSPWTQPTLTAMPSPIDAVTTPQIVAAVLILYLKMLPHPLVPPSYFHTALRIACIPHTAHRSHQARILIIKLPPIPRRIQLDTLVSVFMPFFLRPPSHSQSGASAPSPAPQNPTLQRDAANMFVRLLIENAEFMNLSAEIPEATQEGSMESFFLKGKATQDQRGNDVLLEFNKGDKIHLVSVYKEGWIEGILGKEKGLVPASQIVILAVSDTHPLPGVPGATPYNEVTPKSSSETVSNNTPTPSTPAVKVVEEDKKKHGFLYAAKKRLHLSSGKKDKPESTTPALIIPPVTPLGSVTPTTASNGTAAASASPPSAHPDLATLPSGWKLGFDKVSGKYYYVNVHTRKSQWKKPDAPALPATSTDPPAQTTEPQSSSRPQHTPQSTQPTPQPPQLLQQHHQLAQQPPQLTQQQLLYQQMQFAQGGIGPMMGMQAMGGLQPNIMMQPGVLGGVQLGMQGGLTTVFPVGETNVDQALQEKIIALHEAELELEKKQEELKRKERHLEAQRRLDHLKNERPNWQIDFSELELQDQIGEGGFGRVFRGRWRGTEVAVKTLKGGDTASPQEIAIFSKEVSILRSLHHPQLVLFLGASIAPVLAMVSEFMVGGSLFDLLYKKRIIPSPQQRQTFALDMAKAMAYLHNSKPPIIHRDLKSANILLDEKGEHCKVCDVGLARVKSENAVLTGAVGTFAWMPPEMIGGQEYDERADVYSYGLILYELVSGKVPFSGLTKEQITQKILVSDERPPLPSGLTAKWRDLITACWATKMALRPPFIATIDLLPTINSKT
ncbi:protein kinase [Pelomyxa schiedti]|nr:protein kinase [Pelomyxa schiedti]